MRISSGRAALRPAKLVVVCSSLLVSACASGGTFPGPSWNLTGAKDAAQMPPKAIVPAHSQPVPPVTYRGGRNPVSGRALAFGSSPHAYALPPAQPPSAAQALPSVQAPAPAVRASQVEVRPGQSLATIASEQRVSIASLMAANKLRDPYVIPGQVLTIPRP